ncbi:MAG: GDSL-type esterase/lipase family protein [Lachnospiraceae bacterium]|jgi:hypothetical protein|nr:GDSL-type esterase/lipase family protein [Lachnospiraceae bacterium]MDD4525072.1 GDSL-type esterase/lipase family protein [Lachnospiraceae bacterium]
MRRFFQKIKHMPLTISLAATAIVFTAIAIKGAGSIYDDSERDRLTTPVLSLVFNGINDGEYPWDAFSGKTNETISEASAAEVSEAAQESASEASDTANAETTAMETTAESAAVDEQSTDSAESSSTEVEPEEPVVEDLDVPEAGTETVQLDGKDSALIAVTDNMVNAAENANEEIDVQRESNPDYVEADSMPEGVNSDVMGAVDYGVAGRRYLAPEGAAYNTDTTGLFAENGHYYKFRTVDDSYFSDAIFIGDSRTDGLATYGDMKGTSFLAKESLSVYRMWKIKVPFRFADGTIQKSTVLEVLQNFHFRKVYLSVGVNELGVPTSVDFYDNYRDAISIIRKLQPDAIIYIEGIMHVSKNRSSSDAVFNNTSIVERNTAISTLANGHDIFYIDMNPSVCDENGDLLSDLTGDGIHLKASAYAKWHEFLLQNAIVRSDELDNIGSFPTGW